MTTNNPVSRFANNIVSISAKNDKLGDIKSISLPAVKTCNPSAPCFKYCYARKLAAYRSNVGKSYENNLDVLNSDRDAYFAQIKAIAFMERVFRYHISGDIPDEDYFRRMIKLAEEVPTCTFFTYTKQFTIVNNVIGERKASKKRALPKNLIILFSGWGKDFRPNNPHKLRTAEVVFKGEEKPASWFQCPEQVDKSKKWKCTDCFIHGTGCFDSKIKTIAFLQH